VKKLEKFAPCQVLDWIYLAWC